MSKSAQELYNDYKTLQKQIDALDKRIFERLLFLAKKHPESTIGYIGDTAIKAKTIINFEKFIGTYPVKDRINYIASIETWLKEQNPTKQLTIFDELNNKENADL